MIKVTHDQGDMFIVIAIERHGKLDSTTVKMDMEVFVPITFNTLEEARKWCEEVKVKNRDYLIVGTWNPAFKLAGKVRQQTFQPAC